MSGADRYAAMFAALARRGEGALVPFAVLGDPDRAASLAVLRALADAGADALEVGVPFSDPIADGPVIQAAATRALTAHTGTAECWELVAALRGSHPDVPIGVLTYANLVLRGGLKKFYADAAAAGVDSVLVADVPMDEAAPFRSAAASADVAFVAMAPPNAPPRVLDAVARAAQGYTYVVSRPGVTGADAAPGRGAAAIIAALRERNAAPPLVGFGIAAPEHVREALAMGAAGAISGSSVVARIATLGADRASALREISEFVRGLKAATRGAAAPRPQRG
jgi:tryptophan synthase alpha chain